LKGVAVHRAVKVGYWKSTVDDGTSPARMRRYAIVPSSVH
jgi:hypothetical protein